MDPKLWKQCPRCKGTGVEEYFDAVKGWIDIRDCTYCNTLGVVRK